MPMSSQFTRRDFLKLSTLLPFLSVKWTDPQGRQTRTDPETPNVFILVFDALSATNASLYGYRRETTPNLTRFAERATVYHDHHAGGNFTTPGTASLLTGSYPWSHRAFNTNGTVAERFKKQNIFSAFGEKGYFRSAYSHNLLAVALLYQFLADIEDFTRARELCFVDDEISDRIFFGDYNNAFFAETLMMHGSGTKPGSLFLSFLHRFVRAYHKREITADYGKLFPRGIPNLHNLYFILEQAIDWIMTKVETLPQPYLAYYHLLPPHEPYMTRREFIGRFADGWAPETKKPMPLGGRQGAPEEYLARSRVEYDEYLAYADAEFGRLYDFMMENGTLDNTIFVFTSDHGEMFERGIRGHVTQALYEPITHVPLMISIPGQKERQDVYTPTSCTDLLPTLLHLTGQSAAGWTEGKLLPKLGGEDIPHDAYTMEARSNPKAAPITKATLSLVSGGYKMINYLGYNPGESIFELYDLKKDPEERENIAALDKNVLTGLQSALEAKIKAANHKA